MKHIRTCERCGYRRLEKTTRSMAQYVEVIETCTRCGHRHRRIIWRTERPEPPPAVTVDFSNPFGVYILRIA